MVAGLHSVMMLILLCLTLLESFTTGQPVDLPCQWNSLAGATFDLRPLTVVSSEAMSYHIRDGDIPCTKETEPTYSFIWNFCHKVTNASIPHHICRDGQQGAALQYLNRSSDGYHECHVIGRYDANNDDNEFSLLESHNPAMGVSMKYPLGEKCPGNILRSATIDVKCDNVEKVIESALEPTKCQYRMQMRSYYGCPTECPVTSQGLCR